ncbi:hypothetical protein SteCoe_11260 [Stentor coeruleus]|uniref:TNFR-Cys domain-containing protein n=1 Tax=Stentor coeruleus TaxID=5963 RepID=A0A1R2CDR8_9CILI|nr:hypothetical protein SteCoe_11260 [Stentor coeruleus]
MRKLIFLALTQLLYVFGDTLSFSSTNFDGLYCSFTVIVLDITNTIVPITNLVIYIYRDPPGTSQQSWRIYTNSGTAEGTAEIWCIGKFVLVADSPNYVSGKSPQFNREVNDYCFPLEIIASPLVIAPGNYITFYSQIIYDTGEFINSPSLELTETGGSAIIGTSYFGANPGYISTTFTFDTIGIKNIMVVFYNYYINVFSVVVTDKVIKINFPVEIPLHTMMTFSVDISILDYNTLVLNTTGNYDIDINAVPSGTLIGFSTVTTSLGVYTLSGLYFTVGGNYYINAISANLGTRSSEAFTIMETSLKISFKSSVPINSGLFSILVEIYSSDFLTKYTDGSYLVSVKLEPLNLLKGSGNTIGGNFEILNLSIDTEGDFYLRASSSGFIDGFSQNLTINNLFLGLNSSSTILTTQDIFSVVINIYDDSYLQIPYTNGYYYISLSINNSGIITGTVSGNSINGRLSLTNLTVTTEGIFFLQGTGTNLISSQSMSLTIKNYYISLNFPKGIPSNTTTLFDVNAYIYSDLARTITELSKVFEVNILLSPSGSIIGTTNSMISNGIASFLNLQILSENNYTLVAYGAGFMNETSAVFEIKNMIFNWSVIVNSSNHILINFASELLEDLTSSDFLLSLNPSLNIITVFNGGNKQNYSYSVYPNRTIPDQTAFSLEVIKSNVRSITGGLLNNTIYNLTFNYYDPKCIASEYYEVYLKQCFACNNSCSECFGPTYYECSKCYNSSLLNGICVSECPLGYTNITDSECLQDKTKTKIISFSFEGAGDKFYDEIYNIQAIGVSNSSSRRLTEAYPYSVYLRGIYFPGQSALKLEFINQMLLSNNFALSLWLKPESANGTLISKYSGLTLILKITIESYFPTFSINIEGITYNITSKNALELGWNHLLISLNSSLGMSIIVNGKDESPIYFTNSSFVDLSNSSLYIGSDSTFEKIYTGFIYNLDIYQNIPNVTKIVQSNCLGCNYCQIGSSCIPSCNIGEFYDNINKKCSNCPKECPDICRSSDSCDLCVDNYCTSCKTYDKNSCVECIPEYEVIDYLCYNCTYGYYYSYNSAHCESCVGLCDSCKSETLCLTCKENSLLNSNNECVCKKGYSLFDKCERNMFGVVMMLSQENVATLIFDEELESSLKVSQLEVSIDNKKVSFAINPDSLSKFYIAPEIPEQVTKNSNLNITIISDLISIDNSLLKNTIFTASLFVSDDLIAEIKLTVKAQAAKAVAKTGSTAGVSVALGVSFMNFDPTSLFDFLNTAEMFYAVYLMELNTNKILSEFLLGLRMQDMIPNAYSYTVDFTEGEKMPDKFKKLGFKRNLVLINGGGQLSTLTIFLGLWIAVALFSKISKLKPKLEKVRKIFKYSIFLRFWLQTYFELAIVSTFGLKYSKFANATQIVDVVVCLLIISFQIFILGVMLYVIYKRWKLTDEEAIKKHEDKFSTFFDEFKNTGLNMWMFYVFYILRRTLLVISYLYIEDGSLQLSICISLCLAIPLYVITCRSFKATSQTIYHFFNEIIIAAYYSIILVGEVSENRIMSEDDANICIKLITAAWGMNIAVSLFGTTLMIFEKIRNYIRKKREERTARAYRMKTVPENENNPKTLGIE